MGVRRITAVAVIVAWLMPLAAVAGGMASLRILLTNDDGWDSPAIQAMKTRLRAGGHEVVLAAPADNRSGSGAALTLGGVPVVEQAPGEYAVDGTPATCVFIGLALMGGSADLVISGANIGFNGGNGGIHSGTLGAAMTGAELGLPALAVATDPPSSDPFDAVSLAHFANVADFTARLIDALGDGPGPDALLPHGVALKIGYPPRAPEDVAGVRLAEQGEAGLFSIGYTQVAPGLFVPSITPGDPSQLDPASDTALYLQGYVTLLPLDIDQTAGPRDRAHLLAATRDIAP